MTSLDVYAIHTDVMAHGCWKAEEGSTIQTEGLLELLRHSRATGTVKKYTQVYTRWRQWEAGQKAVNAPPVGPLQLCSYLEYLKWEHGSKAAVEEAVSHMSSGQAGALCGHGWYRSERW